MGDGATGKLDRTLLSMSITLENHQKGNLKAHVNE